MIRYKTAEISVGLSGSMQTQTKDKTTCCVFVSGRLSQRT
jgi:hypothetical protein